MYYFLFVKFRIQINGWRSILQKVTYLNSGMNWILQSIDIILHTHFICSVILRRIHAYHCTFKMNKKKSMHKQTIYSLKLYLWIDYGLSYSNGIIINWISLSNSIRIKSDSTIPYVIIDIYIFYLSKFLTLYHFRWTTVWIGSCSLKIGTIFD